MAGLQPAIKFTEGLYVPFRPPRDEAGLECLDSRCDLWESWGKPSARRVETTACKLEPSDATNAVQPLIGFKLVRGCDRFALRFTALKNLFGGTSATPPWPFWIGVKLGQASAGEDFQFLKTQTVPTFDRSGLIVQLSGLLFDTVQIWGGVATSEIATVGPMSIVFRVLVDRCGHGSTSENFTTIDGPFK